MAGPGLMPRKTIDKQGSQWLSALALTVLPAAAAGIVGFFNMALAESSALSGMWYADAAAIAIALSLTVRFPTPPRIALVALSSIASAFALLAVHLTISRPDAALTMAFSHGLEIAAVLSIARHWRSTDPGDPVSFGSMLGTFFFASLLSAGASVIALPAQSGHVAGGLWFVTHASALIVIVPLGLVALAPSAARRAEDGEHTGKPIWVSPAILAAVTLGTAAVFAQSSMPFLFMVTPLVVLAGLVLGTRGTALAIAVMATIAVTATVLGSGPVTLTRGEPDAQLAALQMFLAVLVIAGLPLAGLIERTRMDRRALIASHDEKRRVLDNIDEVIFRVDPDGRWVTLNAAWERITGRSRQECLGKPFHDFLGDKSDADEQEKFARLIRGERGLVTSIHTIERPDGEMRHVEVSMRAAFDSAGHPIGLVGHIRDISERTSHQIALEESERKFSTLANAAPVGIWRTNARGEALSVNSAFRDMTGLRDGEWEGSQWTNAIHPLDFDRVMNAWTQAIKDRGEFQSEWRWQRPDGSIIWVATVGAPQFDTGGKLTGFVGLNIDITERRTAELLLAERESQIRTIVNNVRDALFLIAPDGRCSFASPFAATMLGLPVEEITGKRFDRLLGGDAAETVSERLEPVWRGEVSSCEISVQLPVNANGGALWLEGHVSVVRDPVDRAPTALIASLRDVTEAKKLQEQLTAARRHAEHAAETKTSFLANMSHEIRTPMNGVIGFTELLLESELTMSQQRHVQMIADSGRAMMRLLNDILDMSKIESGQLSVQPAPVDLRHKVTSCANLLKPVTDRKGIALGFTVDDDVPARVIGDPLRIRQILLNLMGNAVKFTEIGAVRIHARIERSDQGDSIAIDVTDSGIGIAPEKLDLIFGQFRQGDDSIGRRFGGTGLGLAISSQLAGLMGGRLSVRSQQGVGTCFTLHLPLVRTDANTPALSTADNALGDIAEVEDSHASGKGRRLRTLVAEDHDINQELVMAMARRAGLEPYLARNGAEAVSMVEQAIADGKPFELVLMDMQMPEVDGLEATRRIRAMGIDGAQLPIVALTANCYADDIAACRNAGMQGHLAKPLQLMALRSAIAVHVGDAGSRRATKFQPRSPARVTPISGDLAARYEERKRDTLLALAAIAEGAQSPQWDVLAQQLHKLAGSAGYFGDGALGERARILQDRLRIVESPEERLRLLREEWETMKAA